MSAFSILTLTCRLGRYSERPSLFFSAPFSSLRTRARCPTGSRRRLQWPRGLSKHVPPSRRRAVASYEDKIIGEDPIHGGNVIFLHRLLIFGVKCANCVFSALVRNPAARTPLNIASAAAASAKSPARTFFSVLRFHAIPLSRPEMCSRFAIVLHWTTVTNRCRSRLLGCTMCGNIAGALPQQNGGIRAPRTPGL